MEHLQDAINDLVLELDGCLRDAMWLRQSTDIGHINATLRHITRAVGNAALEVAKAHSDQLTREIDTLKELRGRLGSYGTQE